MNKIFTPNPPFKILAILLALSPLSPAPILAATEDCADNELQMHSGQCYPVFYGQGDSGAHYTLVKPEDWQAQDGLVIWNHGFQSFLTGFESTDFSSLLDPNWEGYYTGSPQAEPGLGPFAELILSQGYAMAASSYSQTGWAVFDSHISNKELYDAFLALEFLDGGNQGAPEKLFLVGGSLGGIVTMRDLEAGLLPEADGALLLCGAVGGAGNWDNAFDLRMIYENVCRNVDGADLPSPWYERPDLLFGEIEFLDSLNECTGFATRLLIDDNNPLEILAWQLIHAEEASRLEEILELSGTDNSFFLGLNLWYSVFQLPRLINDETQLNGLIPFTNPGIDYGDEATNLGIQRTLALPSSRELFLQNYTPDGAIGNSKILSIHTSNDGLVKVENQRVLLDLIASNQLSVAIVDDSSNPSHCGFSEAEATTAWNSLVDWVDGGSQPNATSIQSGCVNNFEGPDCNFDPGFTIGPSFPEFPRGQSVTSVGNNSFVGATGEVSMEALRISGDSTLHSVVLTPPAAGSSLFTVKELQTTGQLSPWQHGAIFDPEQSLLYLPDLQILDSDPVDGTAYDVYFRYGSENGVDGLQFLEYEIQP